MVNVVDCQPTQTLLGDAAAGDDDRECGDFAPGRFAWKRGEFRLFDQPIPYRGARGIFNVPDDLIPISRIEPFPNTRASSVSASLTMALTMARLSLV